jgi:hypothetical protein
MVPIVTTMSTEFDVTRTYAEAYLVTAGWSRGDDAVPGRLAMRFRSTTISLTLWYTPEDGMLRLVIELRGAAALGGIFRGGSADLRVFGRSPDALGLLCWLTSSQGELARDTVSDWIDQAITICPETYAVVSAPGEPEELAAVTGAGRCRVLH